LFRFFEHVCATAQSVFFELVVSALYWFNCEGQAVELCSVTALKGSEVCLDEAIIRIARKKERL